MVATSNIYILRKKSRAERIKLKFLKNDLTRGHLFVSQIPNNAAANREGRRGRIEVPEISSADSAAMISSSRLKSAAILAERPAV